MLKRSEQTSSGENNQLEPRGPERVSPSWVESIRIGVYLHSDLERIRQPCFRNPPNRLYARRSAQNTCSTV